MELGNPQNWTTLYEQGMSVLYTADTQGNIFYAPLPPISVTSPSPVIHVLTDSLANTPPTWRIAGWIEFEHQLFDNPNRYEDEKPLRLNKGNLFLWQDLDLPLPYKITIRFPKWLERIRLIIRCYIDESGRYSADPDLAKLRDDLEGKTYELVNPTYATNSSDPTLVDSIFVIDVTMERFQVGAFRDKATGQFIKNPYFEIAPYKVTAVFTGRTQVRPGTITVDIGL